MSKKKIEIGITIAAIVVSFMFFNNSGTLDYCIDINYSGNNEWVQKDKEIDHFQHMEIDGVCNVFLTQGKKDKVVVETYEQMQKYVEVETKNGTLYIDTKKGKFNKKFKKVNVYITFNSVSDITHSGVGNMKSTNQIKEKSLNLKIKGVGNTNMNIDTEQLNVRSSAVGNIKLTGKSTTANFKSSGVGSVNAGDLLVDKMDLHSSGVGSVHVNVKEELSIHASGVGSVKYKGDPVITGLTVQGVGKVKKVE